MTEKPGTTSKLLSLLTIYVDTFCQINDNKGLIESSRELVWEPYMVVDLMPFESSELMDLMSTCTHRLTYKLLITHLYLKLGHEVTWNYRINRSTTIDIWVDALKTGYYIPDTESYEFAKDYRKRRLTRNIPHSRIYIAHPTLRPVKYNSYWKTSKWFAQLL